MRRPWACCIPLPTLGFTTFRGHPPTCSPIARCAVRVTLDPPRSAVSLRSLSSSAAGSASPRPFCPLAVASPCHLAGSARVRKHRAKAPARLRRLRPPGDGSVPPDPPLARLVDQGFVSRRHLPAEAGAATASRLEWGCSGRLPGPPQPPSPLPRRLRGERWARKPSRVLLPPKRLGHPALRPDDRPTRSPAKPQTSPPLARESRPGCGAFSTRLLRVPLPAHVLGSSSASCSASRPCSANESRIPSAPCDAAWIRSSLGFLSPFQSHPSLQPAPARAGPPLRSRGTASTACAV